MDKISILNELKEVVDSDPALSREFSIEKQRYELSRLLREIRQNNNYSQNEIAKKIGLTQQMVSKIETYNGNPSLESFLKYCDGIGINISELIKEKFTSNTV